MLYLLNGRGQLGTCLSAVSDQVAEDIYIYHTWTVDDKSKEKQEKEYHKFKTYVENNRDKKIAFISTKSERDTWYTHYKQMSEVLLLTKCENGVVIRMPTFIGKPCKIFSTKEEVQPHGYMELISLETAAEKIVEICNKITKRKMIEIKGETVSAHLIRDIVKTIK